MEITLRMRMSTHEKYETQDRCRVSAFIRDIARVASGVVVDMPVRASASPVPWPSM